MQEGTSDPYVFSVIYSRFNHRTVCILLKLVEQTSVERSKTLDWTYGSCCTIYSLPIY